jgi:hypothetical protein
MAAHIKAFGIVPGSQNPLVPQGSSVVSKERHRMRYAEVNLFGVLVSPVAPMLLAAWLLLMAFRAVADRSGLTRHIWHPALANLCVLVIILSAIVVGVGRLG